MNNIDKLIADNKNIVVSTIKKYQWDLIPDSQLHAAKAALSKNNYISKIALENPGAVHDSLLRASVLGVDLTEGKKQAYLLPRRNAEGNTVIQLQVGYKGVEAIHQKMGVIDRLVIRVVRKEDEFDWSGDDSEKPSHKANWMAPDEERGPIIGAYSITYFPDGSLQTMTAPISEIYEKHRDISDSWKQYQRKVNKGEQVSFPPPWVTHEKAMIEKTMAYIASKQWPANNRNQELSSKILETLHEVDTSDYVEAFTSYSNEEKELFDTFIEANDSLGMYLFSRKFIENENLQAWFDIQNSFPKGHKVKGKENVVELCKTGNEIYLNIISAIDTDDKFLLLENLDGALKRTKAMLWRSFSTDQQNKANIMLSEQQSISG